MEIATALKISIRRGEGEGGKQKNKKEKIHRRSEINLESTKAVLERKKKGKKKKENIYLYTFITRSSLSFYYKGENLFRRLCRQLIIFLLKYLPRMKFKREIEKKSILFVLVTLALR